MSYKIDVVLKNVCSSVGEGPHWEPKSNSLLFVDIQAGDIHRWNPVTDEDQKVHIDDTTVSLVVPTSNGKYVYSKKQELHELDWDTKASVLLADVGEGEGTRLNDGKCDPRGRLWAGTMGLETGPAEVTPGTGSLYCLGNDKKLTHKIGNLSISNGLAWTSDHTVMYFIDSLDYKVYGYDYDVNSGEIANKRVVVDITKFPDHKEIGFPDGMTIDTDGKILVACFNGGRVIRFDPETGKILQQIKLPTSRTTSATWGGVNHDELYVTCSSWGFSSEQLQDKEALAGSVFKITGLGYKGHPSNVYEAHNK